MINFLAGFILPKNTKYFSYLRFFTIGIILIPVLFMFFKPIPIVEAQPMDLGGGINGNVSPIHASTSITISGAVTGDATDNGNCMSVCGEGPTVNEVEAHGVIALRYRIDGGTWVNITSYLSQTQQGEDSYCPCTEYILYEYSYSRLINISALPQGNHTINVQAESQSGGIWETGPMPFDNIPFDFQVAPEVDSGSVYQSGSHSVGIRVGRLSGQAAVVSLSATDTQATITETFSPISCTPNDECVSTMTIQTRATTPTGTYAITITGISGAITHTATYNLTVNPLPAIMITSLTADPSFDQAPLMDVGIFVNTNGTAIGPMLIEIDCAYNGSTPAFDYTINTNPASTSYYYGPTTTGAGTGCDYPLVAEDSYMVLTRVTRAGSTAEATTMVNTSLAALDYCAQQVSGGGAQLIAGIIESWPTDSMQVYRAGGLDSSLRGGFYEMDFSCTACLAEDNTDYRTGEITAFEYRFDNTGLWAPLTRFPIFPPQWAPISETGLSGCYIWTGCCLQEQYMYNMYSFDFTLNVSALSVGNHTLNLRAKEEWSHDGGFSPNNSGIWFDPYDFVNTIYENVPFAKNGSPGISLVSPGNGSYVSSGNPDPIFSATVTDPNIGQSLFAHFQVAGFGEYDGSTATTPGISSWGPVAGFNDGTYFWRAYAQDEAGATSSWSGYWSFTRDTILPTASISYPINDSYDINIPVILFESDERTGISEGNAQVRSRLVGGTWGLWGIAGIPSSGITIDDFTYAGTAGREYEFRYRAIDGARNISDWVSGGTIIINNNAAPVVTNLNRIVPDFCSVSPAYFFSWTYSDPDIDVQSRFDFQIDDSGLSFPSPEINRTYSGLSNPSPTTNNQAVIVLLAPQADYLTYGRTYNWRARVYDANNLSSSWINGTAFTTPSHHSPSCGFTWSPTSLNPEEVVNFNDTSICYDAGGKAIPCVGWDWTFTDGNPATSTQQNPTIEFTTSGTKNVTLTVVDSFGSQCSITRQVTVSLLPSKWREIRPW